MKTFDELERLWNDAAPAPRGRGTLTGICVRKGGGVHETPERVEITLADGVVGDRWTDADDAERMYQVTLMSSTVADLIAHGDVRGHEAGDNFYVHLDISASALPDGARLRLGTAVLELTPEPHTGCKVLASRFGQDALRWINWSEHRERRLRGINCRVVEGGFAKIGDEVVVLD